MKDGRKKVVFRKGKSPNGRLDFGKHVENTFPEVYLGDTRSTEATPLQWVT